MDVSCLGRRTFISHEKHTFGRGPISPVNNLQVMGWSYEYQPSANLRPPAGQSQMVFFVGFPGGIPLKTCPNKFRVTRNDRAICPEYMTTLWYSGAKAPQTRVFKMCHNPASAAIGFCECLDGSQSQIGGRFHESVVESVVVEDLVAVSRSKRGSRGFSSSTSTQRHYGQTTVVALFDRFGPLEDRKRVARERLRDYKSPKIVGRLRWPFLTISGL